MSMTSTSAGSAQSTTVTVGVGQTTATPMQTVVTASATPAFADTASKQEFYDNLIVVVVRRRLTDMRTAVTEAVKQGILNAIGVASSLSTSDVTLTGKTDQGTAVKIDYRIEVPAAVPVPAALTTFVSATTQSDLENFATSLRQQINSRLQASGVNITVETMNVTAAVQEEVTSTTTSAGPAVTDSAEWNALSSFAAALGIMAAYLSA